MFNSYDTWLMIFVFLIGIPFLIYGAYWIKKRSWLWSPIRTTLLDKEQAEPPVKPEPKDFSKNIERMKAIADDEDNYVPKKKLLKAEILAMKNELEGQR